MYINPSQMAKKGYTILDFLRTYSKNMIDFSSKKTKGFATLKINFIYIFFDPWTNETMQNGMVAG